MNIACFVEIQKFLGDRSRLELLPSVYGHEHLAVVR